MSPQQKQKQDKNKQTKPNQNKTNKAKQNKTKQNKTKQNKTYIYIYIYRLDEPHDAFEVHFPIFFYGRQNMFRIKHRPSPVV